MTSVIRGLFWMSFTYV